MADIPTSNTGNARLTPLTVPEFERFVANSLDALDEELVQLMENVIVLVEDRNPDEPDLLGLYEGIPLTERDSYGFLDLPDRVTIYRLALCDFCTTHDELVDEIRTTVIHEVAHHFGIDDERLEELGWD